MRSDLFVERGGETNDQRESKERNKSDSASTYVEYENISASDRKPFRLYEHGLKKK
jgi:hypothetical protein